MTIEIRLNEVVIMAFCWTVFLIEGIICRVLSQIPFFQDNVDTIAFCVPIITFPFIFFAILKQFGATKESVIVITHHLLFLALMWYDVTTGGLSVNSDANAFYLAAIKKSIGQTTDYGGVYTDLIGFIFRVFGINRMIAQYFNALLTLSMIFMCQKIFVVLQVQRMYRIIGLFALAFCPNYLLVAVILRREAIVACILSVSLFYFICWCIRKKAVNLIVAVVLSFCAAIFHSGAVIFAVAYATFYFLYDWKKKKIHLRPRILVGFLIIGIMFTAAYTEYGDVFFSKFQNENIETVSDYTNMVKVGKGGAGYDASPISTGNETVDAILNTPVRMFYFLLAPVPWDWRGIKDVAAFVFSSVYYLAGYFFVFRALKNKEVTAEEKAVIEGLFWAMFLVCIVFSWGSYNAAQAMRHRNKFLAAYIVMSVFSMNVSTRIRLSSKNSNI